MSEEKIKAAAAALPVKPAAGKLEKFTKPELKAFGSVEELAGAFKSEGYRLQGETLRSGWALGWHVQQIVDHAAYGEATIETLAALLGQGYGKSTLYTMAQLHSQYEWKRIEKLINGCVPLRAVQRLLGIEDEKLRNELEDKLIAGEVQADEVTDEANKVLKKLVAPPAPAKAKKNEKPKTKDEQGGNSLLSAVSKAEEAGLLFISSLSDLTKAIDGFDMVCKADIRKAGEQALAKFYEEVLAEFPSQLDEINTRINDVSSKACAQAKPVAPAKAPVAKPTAPKKSEAIEL